MCQMVAVLATRCRTHPFNKMMKLIWFFFFFLFLCSHWMMCSDVLFAWRNCMRPICVRIARNFAATCAYRVGWTNNVVSVHIVGHRCTLMNWWIAVGSKMLPFKWNRCNKYAPTSKRLYWRKVRTINAPHTMRNWAFTVGHVNAVFVINVHSGVAHIPDIHSNNLVSCPAIPYQIKMNSIHNYNSIFWLQSSFMKRILLKWKKKCHSWRVDSWNWLV